MAQLVARRSGGPEGVGSSPTIPTEVTISRDFREVCDAAAVKVIIDGTVYDCDNVMISMDAISVIHPSDADGHFPKPTMLLSWQAVEIIK